MKHVCFHCGQKTETNFPSFLWYPNEFICGDCCDKEQDEYQKEQVEEDEDFYEDLRISHMYSWCYK